VYASQFCLSVLNVLSARKLNGVCPVLLVSFVPTVVKVVFGPVFVTYQTTAETS